MPGESKRGCLDRVIRSEDANVLADIAFFRRGVEFRPDSDDSEGRYGKRRVLIAKRAGASAVALQPCYHD